MMPLTAATSAVNVSIYPPCGFAPESACGAPLPDRGAAFEYPKRGESTNCIRGGARPPVGNRDREAPDGGTEREHGRYEHELAELDADVEEEERERHRALGHADLGQRAGEAEAVQQPERERDDPGEAGRQVLLLGYARGAAARELRGEKQDAQGDRRFDRRARHPDPAERGHAERDAVRDGGRKGG